MQRVVEQNVIAAAQQMEDHLDGELHRLENLDGDDLERLRERRIKQLKQQAARKQQWLARGHGEYQDIPAEKEFFSAMKGEERMVCHFYRENWPCKVSDPTPWPFGAPHWPYTCPALMVLPLRVLYISVIARRSWTNTCGR